MTLNFTFTEDDAIAFTERFLRDSKSHQATRNRVRWVVPIMLIAIFGYSTWKSGFSPAVLVFNTLLGFAWSLLYPRRFDANIRSYAKRQMAETSYAKSLGRYELQLLDEHLHSTSPLGSGDYTWSAVDRVAMDDSHLYIFLSGPLGYPIRITEIGQDAAQRAHDFIAERIKLSRQ